MISMFVTICNSTTKIQKISEITKFFRYYFLSRTQVDKYDLFILYGSGTVKAGTTKVTLNEVDYDKFANHNLIGNKVEEYISKRVKLLDWSYTVSSDGTIKVSSNSSSTTTE